MKAVIVILLIAVASQVIASPVVFRSELKDNLRHSCTRDVTGRLWKPMPMLDRQRSYLLGMRNGMRSEEKKFTFIGAFMGGLVLGFWGHVLTEALSNGYDPVSIPSGVHRGDYRSGYRDGSKTIESARNGTAAAYGLGLLGIAVLTLFTGMIN